MPDITVQKFHGYQAPLAPVLTQALNSSMIGYHFGTKSSNYLFIQIEATDENILLESRTLIQNLLGPLIKIGRACFFFFDLILHVM